MRYHIKKSADQQRVIVFTIPDYNTFLFEIDENKLRLRSDVFAKYWSENKHSGALRVALKFMETGGKIDVGDKVFIKKANAGLGMDGIVTYVKECDPPLYFVNDWNEGLFETELYKIYSDEDQS